MALIYPQTDIIDSKDSVLTVISCGREIDSEGTSFIGGKVKFYLAIIAEAALVYV